MTPSQHFLLSFAVSLFVATLMALGVYMAQDYLNQLKVPAPVVMLVAFIIGHLGMRWVFSHFVPVKCPYGCGSHAYAIPGRTDRFRCHSCGQDF
jgi:hypothetical protein